MIWRRPRRGTGNVDRAVMAAPPEIVASFQTYTPLFAHFSTFHGGAAQKCRRQVELGKERAPVASKEFSARRAARGLGPIDLLRPPLRTAGSCSRTSVPVPSSGFCAPRS